MQIRRKSQRYTVPVAKGSRGRNNFLEDMSSGRELGKKNSAYGAESVAAELCAGTAFWPPGRSTTRKREASRIFEVK